MVERDTSVSALCVELGIQRVTLYRYVGHTANSETTEARPRLSVGFRPPANDPSRRGKPSVGRGRVRLTVGDARKGVLVGADLLNSLVKGTFYSMYAPVSAHVTHTFAAFITKESYR